MKRSCLASAHKTGFLSPRATEPPSATHSLLRSRPLPLRAQNRTRNTTALPLAHKAGLLSLRPLDRLEDREKSSMSPSFRSLSAVEVPQCIINYSLFLAPSEPVEVPQCNYSLLIIHYSLLLGVAFVMKNPTSVGTTSDFVELICFPFPSPVNLHPDRKQQL